jgi:large subunit ribosomal protein L18
MISKIDKNENRKKRHLRIRKKVNGTPNCPRLNVFKSLNNIYAQIIDDTKGVTLVAASSLEVEIKSVGGHTGNKDAAKRVGLLIGKKALAAGIENVVFDRGGYIYHGRVKELGDGAREAGLKF